MNTQELLNPRYKVIADYPDNKDFQLGKIIDFHPWVCAAHYWEHSVEDCQGKRTWLSEYFDKYPHLFRKLEWWEERNENDIQYVKYLHEEKNIWVVLKVNRYAIEGKYTYAYVYDDKSKIGRIQFEKTDLPATEEEYNNYKISIET
jgi:hypothetical protein